MPRCPALAPLLALCLSPAVARADEPFEEPLHFGLQVTAASPRQDLGDLSRKGGAGGGFFVEEDQGGGWSCRARFDFLTFGQSGVARGAAAAALLPSGAQRLSGNLFSIGGEARWRVKGLPGLVLLGGAFGSRWEYRTTGPTGLVDANGIPVPGTVERKDRTSFKLGLAGGAGYALSERLTLTMRYTATNLGGITLATLEGGLDYRF